tara:strand:+ start:478 stop:855 length:378 start_codon:yes stop_codon:yes gene_type:complete
MSLVKRKFACNLAVLGLAFSIAVPAGLMPSSIDEGFFLKICPTQNPGYTADEGHIHHHDHSYAGNTYVQCDLSSGGSPYIGPLNAEIIAGIIASEFKLVSSYNEDLLEIQRFYNWISRAPPIRFN